MPVLIESAGPAREALLAKLPSNTHALASLDRLSGWMEGHPDEYLVVLGPGIDRHDVLDTTTSLFEASPKAAVVVIRSGTDPDFLTAAFRAGARDVIDFGDDAALEAAVERASSVAEAIRGAAPGQSGKVVNVFSPKGGVGKTTVAVNLAVALASDGHHVCVVDLDLAFGDVAISLQLIPTNSVYEAVGAEGGPDAEFLSSLLSRHKSGVMVLPAPPQPDLREAITPLLVTHILRQLRRQFEYVLVDNSPQLDEITLAALDETDETVVVATLDVPTLKNVRVALDTLDLVDVATGHRHLFLNRADERIGLAQRNAEDVLGLKVVSAMPTDLELVAATNAGQPISMSNPNHPASVAFRELARAITGGERTDLVIPGGDHKRQGWFRRKGNR